MRRSLEFILGVLDHGDPAYVAAEDMDGEHGLALRCWQEMGFVSREPLPNPIPSCPHCDDGVPYAISGRFLCPRCHSDVDERNLLVWRLAIDALLRWLSEQLALQGGVRRVGDTLWQLGTGVVDGEFVECFYCRGGQLSDAGRSRLSAYRSAVVFAGPTGISALRGLSSRCVGLVDLLRMDNGLAVTDLRSILRPRGSVRFDAHSGALWAGDSWLGEVPFGSKEFHFLDLLSRNLDHFVPYADLKHFVLRQSGSQDTMEEATFCHNLKNRIKKKWIGKIDLLLATTNKAEGYRLRRNLEPCL